MTLFGSSLRALEASELRGGRLVLASTAVLLAAWSAWGVFGRVSVYAVSERARFEVDQAAYTAAPVVGGIVVSNGLTLGREVHAGDELLVLDSTTESLALAQERSRLETNTRLLTTAKKELELEEKVTALQAESGLATREVARVRSQASKLAAEKARQQDESVQRLHRAELASGTESLQSSATAEQRRFLAIEAAAEAQRVASEQRMTLADRVSRKIRLERDVGQLEGQIAASQALIKSLEFEIERRTLRAPVDGRVADVVPAPKGTVVASGQRVASVVPPGHLRIVARYLPAEAVGRVRRGCLATVRLDAFPSAQYGTHRASVIEVASEAHDNSVRVELHVTDANPHLPLTHGLTARVDVEIEEVRPIEMLVRALGYFAVGGARGL
jgi:multidrug resistance efflux pump